MPELKERLLPIPERRQRGIRRFRKAHDFLFHSPSSSWPHFGNPADVMVVDVSEALAQGSKLPDLDPQYLALIPGSNWYLHPQRVALTPASKSWGVDLQYIASATKAKWPDYLSSEWESLRWQAHGVTEQRAEPEQEYAALRQENDQLSKQVAELRKLLAKIARRQSDDKPHKPGNLCDSRTSAAEMLASVDSEGFELLIRILEIEEIGIDELLKTSDLSLVVRLVSWLSSSHAVTVQDDTLSRTDFGRQLWVWLMDSTELKIEE